MGYIKDLNDKASNNTATDLYQDWKLAKTAFQDLDDSEQLFKLAVCEYLLGYKLSLGDTSFTDFDCEEHSSSKYWIKHAFSYLCICLTKSNSGLSAEFFELLDAIYLQAISLSLETKNLGDQLCEAASKLQHEVGDYQTAARIYAYIFVVDNTQSSRGKDGSAAGRREEDESNSRTTFFHGKKKWEAGFYYSLMVKRENLLVESILIASKSRQEALKFIMLSQEYVNWMARQKLRDDIVVLFLSTFIVISHNQLVNDSNRANLVTIINELQVIEQCMKYVFGDKKSEARIAAASLFFKLANHYGATEHFLNLLHKWLDDKSPLSDKFYTDLANKLFADADDSNGTWLTTIEKIFENVGISRQELSIVNISVGQ